MSDERKPWQRLVEDFHDHFDLATSGGYEISRPMVRDAALRIRLLREECQELCQALMAGDMVETADGIADLIYIALGTADSCGIDMDPIFREVHRSNMTKDGGIDSGGKLTKGEGFEEPRIAELLRLQGWEG